MNNMNDSEILEGNILIAEFMGATKRNSKSEGEFYMIPDKLFTVLPRELKYHKLWDDWLMPVIAKIALDKNVKGISITPTKTRIWTLESFIEYGFVFVNNEPMIVRCFGTVVKFIKWHNELR